ncbi:MAG: hypothetical protein P8N99_00465, partial [Luminiphilus sp.]|nr:hypothetical protein [Luminiphilus sp.]
GLLDGWLHEIDLFILEYLQESNILFFVCRDCVADWRVIEYSKWTIKDTQGFCPVTEQKKDGLMRRNRAGARNRGPER